MIEQYICGAEKFIDFGVFRSFIANGHEHFDGIFITGTIDHQGGQFYLKIEIVGIGFQLLVNLSGFFCDCHFPLGFFRVADTQLFKNLRIDFHFDPVCRFACISHIGSLSIEGSEFIYLDLWCPKF